MIFNKYSKEASYSYVFGAFGTIELLKNKKKSWKNWGKIADFLRTAAN